MRKHAEWMSQADDRILEFLHEEGNHQPAQIKSRMQEIGADMEYHPKYIGERCRELTEYGLLYNIGNGVYTITENGISYLEGELDAETLDKKTNTAYS